MCDKDCPQRSFNCHKGCKIYLIGKMMQELEAKKRRKETDVAKFLAAEMRVVNMRKSLYQKKR